MRKFGRRRATAIAMSTVMSVGSLLGLRPAMAQTPESLFHYPSPGFTGSCSTGGSGTTTSSTVEVGRKGTDLVVSIQLIGAAPSTTYRVSTPEPSCSGLSYDATIATDANGDGSVQYLKSVAAGTKTVIVSVLAPDPPCPPSANPCIVFTDIEYRSAELKV